MSALTNVLKNLTLNPTLLRTVPATTVPVRFVNRKNRRSFVEVPKPGSNAFRFKVHYPEEYTVEPLKTTHLAGRDPVTGRVVTSRIGGGVKHKYHWVKWVRDGPEEGPPKQERVLDIIKCGCRTGNVALVGHGDELRYYLATSNMKVGDIIDSSRALPRLPVRPKEGDCYPLGALPIGSIIHNLQLSEESDYTIIHAAGTFGTIKKHLGGKVVVQIPEKSREVLVSPKCVATVGRVSNIEHEDFVIGSAVKSREMGIRPKSGLWHRKTGRFGRKLRAPPPLTELYVPKPEPKYVRHTLNLRFTQGIS